MKNESSRTFIGSVLCVDLVGYSKRSIAQQSAIKESFNRLLAAELKSVSPDDRIILDTGDGAAITFLGDPEACFTFGLRLRDRMNAAAANLGIPDPAPGSGPVRIGINMGPVKLAVDMNGHPNIIGDGINVAERITAFAPPGQIVVSRSFHDMVSRISDEHAALFRYDGMRTDGNVRHHEIYAVETKPATGIATVARRMEPTFDAEASVPRVAPATPVAPKPSAPTPAPAARVPDKASATVPPKGPEPPRRSEEAAAPPGALAEFLRDRRKVAASAAVLVAIIAVEAWMIDQRRPAEAPVSQAGIPAPAVPAPVIAERKETTAAPVAPAKEIIELPKASTKDVRKESPRPPDPKPPEPKPPEPTPPKVVAAAPAKAAEPIPPKPVPAKPPEKPAEAPAKTAVTAEPKAVAKAPAVAAPEPKAPPPRVERAPETKPPPKVAERAPEPKPAPVIVPPAPTASALPPEIVAPKVEAPVVAAAPATAPPSVPPPPQTTLLSRTPINFPPAALQRGIESGTVKARLTINGAGAVTQVAILSANPARIFDREVTRSLENWKFNAGADKRTYDIELTIKRPDLE